MSSKRRNNIPNTNPTAAGIHSLWPVATDISMLGKINDQMLAATMTPEAKPNSSLCTSEGILPRKKYTIAAPSSVPKTGRRRIGAIVVVI